MLVTVLCAVVIIFIYSDGLPSPSDLNPESKNVISECFVRFVDVGEGDCTLAVDGDRVLIVDTGTSENAAVLCAELNSLGIKTIDTVLITHFHSDHMGGLRLLCGRFEIKKLVLPSIVLSNEDEQISEALKCRDAITASGGTVKTVSVGERFSVGKITVDILFHDTALKSENNRSVVARLNAFGTDFLLMGDAVKTTEKKLLKGKIDIDCDVLKVGHHGAKDGTYNDFLNSVTPEYAVISCGEDNDYGHPTSAVLKRLERQNIKIFRTDISGNITFYPDDNNVIIATENQP